MKKVLVISLQLAVVFLIPIHRSLAQDSNNNESVPVYFNQSPGSQDSHLYLVIPRGNSSSCVWTYAGGNAAVPYSSNSQAVAWPNASTEGPMQPQGINFVNDEISSDYDFKVTCVNDYGDTFNGIFPPNISSAIISKPTKVTFVSTATDTVSNALQDPGVPTLSSLQTSIPAKRTVGNYDFIWIILSVIALRALFLKIKSGSRSQKNSQGKNNNHYEENVPPMSGSGKRSKSDSELKSLYREVMKKYHPDFAQSETDKAFRTKLTAKITKAYDQGDIETLRMFQ